MMVEDYRIVARSHGGPEVLAVQPISAEVPGPDEVRVRHRAIGVNFVDTYHRSGLYPGPTPTPLGGEAAGVVEAVGANVTGFAVGDRVGYGTGGQGAYATVRVLPAEHLLCLPDWLSDDAAAALLLKGLTAAYLVGPCAAVKPGDTVLVHAAAGGVGSILVPWLVALGARVIAHVGNPAKMEQVRATGAHKVISCTHEEIPSEVAAFDRAGASIVFDGVGAQSWTSSLRSLRRRGLLVTFGNASGAVAPFTALDLSRAGSVFVTRPTLRDYASTRDERTSLAEALFSMLRAGVIEARIGMRQALEHVGEAHRALEARETSGAIILHT